MSAKLFILVRADLKPGQVLAQSVHAALQFAREHRQTFEDWTDFSNYLIIKEAPDEATLHAVVDRAVARGHKHSLFREPDYDGSLTAIAVEPEGRRLFGGFPLALRGLEVSRPAA